jgi:hypothetical protein
MDQELRGDVMKKGKKDECRGWISSGLRRFLYEGVLRAESERTSQTLGGLRKFRGYFSVITSDCCRCANDNRVPGGLRLPRGRIGAENSREEKKGFVFGADGR